MTEVPSVTVTPVVKQTKILTNVNSDNTDDKEQVSDIIRFCNVYLENSHPNMKYDRDLRLYILSVINRLTSLMD